MRSSVRAILSALAVMSVLLVGSAAAAGTAGAQTAPVCDVTDKYAGTVTLEVNVAEVSPGETITITGSGFPPGCEVTLTVDGVVIGSVVTDAAGNFSFGHTLGANISGAVTIGATAGSFTRTITVPVKGAAPALNCTPKTLTFGDQITCTATGFPANVDVAFNINPPLGTSPSNASGTATITTAMPAQSLFDGPGCGAQTVTATGGGASATDNVTITCAGVTPTPIPGSGTTGVTPTSGALPRTGSESARLVGVALALIAVGGLVVLTTTRRRHPAAS